MAKFKLDKTNYNTVYNIAHQITVKLDYADLTNTRVIYTQDKFQESLIIVDNWNGSCEVYLKPNINRQMICELKEALWVLGFSKDEIFFLSF